jgi:predicted RNA-binding Zn ribbon-like protein
MEPGSRAPAPGDLRLVQEFVNTNDLESGRDEVGSPDLLHAWLVDHGMLRGEERITAADQRRAVEVREAIRALLLANNDGAPVDDAVEVLNRSARETHLGVRFLQDGGAQLQAGVSGAGGAIGRLLAIVFASMADGTWPRLKACRKDTCQWAFYDHSKNRSGAWCSMAVCGNRVKTRVYRQRHRGA